MPIDAPSLENLIRAAIPDAKIRIEDLRGDGDHYAAYIEAASFTGKTRIQQHQMVYAALKTIDLHALAIYTSPPKS